LTSNLSRRFRDAVKARAGPYIARRQPSRVDLPLESWGLAIGGNGALWSGRVDLTELAEREGTPLHVVRADRLDRNAVEARRADRDADVFYSYKTNPVPAVLARLHQHGIGAEVISPYELWLARRLGVPPERLIYNGPAKSVESLRDAIRYGVRMINANSAGEAELISGIAAEERRVVNLGLRVSLRETWGGQFGISDVHRAASVVDAARRSPWVELRGLHVHRGATIRDSVTMSSYVDAALHRVVEIHKLTRWSPSELDLGGSLGCPTSAVLSIRQVRMNRALGTDLLPPEPKRCLSIPDAAGLAASSVRDCFSTMGVAAPNIVLEPGRALTADAQFLLTTVVDVKDDGDVIHAVLDAGMNVAEPVRSEYHQLFSASAPTAAPVQTYRLVGPICTPADVLYHSWTLPPLQPGHLLAIMDSGAYFVPFSTTFSFPKPAIVVQDGSCVHRARRRESFEDIIALDDVP
jgi:diaminopimelate decarboxylase